MDRDRALIAAVGAPGGPDRLERVFAWASPALSLGRSNDEAGIDRESLNRAGIELVRRPTGGGALLHGTDVSYSVAVRRPRGGGGPDLVAEGRALAAPVRAALRALGLEVEFRPCAACDGATPGEGEGPGGLPLCFLQRTPFDLLVAGRKVAAFALRRTAGVLFLHGSVLVALPSSDSIEALARAGAATKSGWTRALGEVTSLSETGGVGKGDLVEALAHLA